MSSVIRFIPRRVLKALSWATLCLAAACGGKAAAPATHTPPAPSPQAQAEAAEPASDAPPPDPFALPEDAPTDPQELLEEMRHDCCTEMSPQEIEKHSKKP